jgi:hypothetical protein
MPEAVRRAVDLTAAFGGLARRSQDVRSTAPGPACVLYMTYVVAFFLRAFVSFVVKRGQPMQRDARLEPSHCRPPPGVVQPRHTRA